ncbi:hypothetical protein FQR65_LT03396 [Abscondita terminalis]|nr:hypothetical protein FQR65_LT03396 [Abscondita terminalis]
MDITTSSLGKINSRETYVVESSTNKSSEKVTSGDLDVNSTSQDLKKASTASIAINEHNYYETDSKNNSSDAYILSGPIDLVESGESLIKFYNFNSCNCKSRTEKCIAFWKTVTTHKSMKPVECVIKRSNSDFSSDCEKSPNEEKDALKIDLEATYQYQKLLWLNTLMEMKKKKMDQLAIGATGAECKICDPKRALSKFKKKSYKYTKEDYEDIVCLNCWVPKSVKKTQIGDKNVSYVTKLYLSESWSPGSSKASSSGEMVCRCTCNKCECASVTYKASKEHKSGDEGSVCKCTCDPDRCECFCVTSEEPQKLQPENMDEEPVCKCDCEQGKCTCFCVVEDEPKLLQLQKIGSYKGDEESVCKCTCEHGECSCFCVVEEESIKLEKSPIDIESNCPCLCEPDECTCTCGAEEKGMEQEKIEDEESNCKCSCAPGECTCSCVADLLRLEKIGGEESICQCNCEPGKCDCACAGDLIKFEKGDEESVCKCTCAFGECTCSCAASIIESREIDEESVCKCACEPGECTCSCVADLLKLEKIDDEESVCKCTCNSGECTCSCAIGSDISSAKSECPICQKETCSCKQHFEEEAQEFVKKVRYELQHLRKDVACSTEEQEELRQRQSNANFCSICEDKEMCEIMHNRIKRLELIIPNKEEDIYFETLFQSLGRSDSLSSTLLPVTRKCRKSTAFMSRTRLSYFAKEFSKRTSSKTVTDTIKTVKKKRQVPNGKVSSTTSKMSSNENSRVSQTQKIERRSLLWYSTDTCQNI